MYRASNFDEHLSEQLKNRDYRNEYLLAIMSETNGENGLPLFEALKHVIGKMGVTEFASLTGIKRSNVSRILSQTTIPKISTLDRFLAPFGLKVKIDVEEIESETQRRH